MSNKPNQLQPGRPRSSASKGAARSPTTFPFPELRPDSPVPPNPKGLTTTDDASSSSRPRSGPSRVVSYLNLASRANSSPEPLSRPPTTPLPSGNSNISNISNIINIINNNSNKNDNNDNDNDNDNTSSLFVREQDKVWYSPNVEQMVEALQVGLMERGSLEPIPVHHNAYSK